ncbi:MAG: flavodoxin/nitric oxide synthase [Lapillicoccus sp.]
MSALVVVESYFGNTRHIADIVAESLSSVGIQTEVVPVEDAPTELRAGIDLLVVGAPTHDSGLSTGETRQAACARSGHLVPGIGVREWVGRVVSPTAPPLVALFDTRTGRPWLPGSAAAQASVLLSHKGFPILPARATFRVQDITGPLAIGEEEHARRWANVVAARVERRRLSQHR